MPRDRQEKERGDVGGYSRSPSLFPFRGRGSEEEEKSSKEKQVQLRRK